MEALMRRRRVLAVAVLAASLSSIGVAHAQFDAGSVKGLLGNASDAALDKLSQPGAFSADDAIRIALPGNSKQLGDLMKLADQAGLTKDLSGSLNRAAEQAAAQAKPIFRSAIDRMTLKDAGSIATGGKTGATDYLKKTSGNDIVAKLSPLVKSALEQAGVFKQSSQLSSVGMTDAKITDYVSKKTADGIYTYMGREEAKVRENPVESGKAILKGLKF